jgi:hypothetical protein
MKIKTNEGTVDRVIRAVLGVLILFGGMAKFLGSGAGMWVAYILGALLLVTGVVGFCPLYAVLKLSTVKK